MKDRIDKILYENSKDDIDIPSSLPNMIIETINEKCFKKEKVERITKMQKNIFFKFATGICACLIFTTTVVFAKEIIETIFKLSKEYYGQESLQRAIEENYIQENKSNEYIKSDNGIFYRFNHVLLNDMNLILSLNFIFEEDLQEYQGITMNELVITDENNNLIYKDGTTEDILKNNIATLMTHYTVEKNEKELQESIILISHKFPDIEKIYVSFDSIVLYNVVDGVPETKTIEGNYNIEIPINSKFNDRNTFYYRVIDKTSREVDIEEIKLTNTGLGIVVNGAEIEGFGYKFKLYDIDDKEIYCKSNLIAPYENTNKYIIWLDVNENFIKESVFKIEITDIRGTKHHFNIEKGVG